MTNEDANPADASKTPDLGKTAEPGKTPEAGKPEGHEPKHGGHHPWRKRLPGGRMALAAAAVAILAAGGGIGATAVAHMKPSVEMAPAAPVAITSMADESVVTVKGSVAEVFGNKFVLADQSGRALIETGRAGEGGKLVKTGEEVTIQGRFDDGFVKAAFLVRADGKVEQIGGFGPKHGPHGPKGPKGPRDDDGPRGPRGDDDGPRGPGRL